MRSVSIAALPLISISLVAACTSIDADDELAEETAEVHALDGNAAGAVDGAYTYFQVSADVRRCAAPLCGGFHLARVNRSTTICHDGTSAARCYTPELDWSEAALSQEQQDQLISSTRGGSLATGSQAIVRGRFVRGGRSQLGRFVVTEAWVADTAAVSDGVFVKVRDNGVRCIQSPCESMTERNLNTSNWANIANIDYVEAGLSQDQLDSVGYELLEPHGLIVVGSRYTVKEEDRQARGRTATAVYRRLAE